MNNSSGTLFLALNSGSSSLKLGLFQSIEANVALIAMGSAEGIGRKDGSLHLRSAAGEVLVEQSPVFESQQQAFAALVTALRQHLPTAPAAIGHRFVHGGPKLRTHQLLTPAVRSELERAQQFAPLHIPQAATCSPLPAKATYA